MHIFDLNVYFFMISIIMINFYQPDFLVPHGDFSAHCVISVDMGILEENDFPN